MTAPRHRMPVAAHLLLRNASGEILFLRRANTGYADGHWSVPAGHVESGESLPAACVREAAEEIGITLATAELTFVLVQHKRDFDGEERLDVFFQAALTGGQHPRIVEADRCDGLVWRSPGRPPAPTVGYIAAALDAVPTGAGAALSCFGFDET